MQMPRKRSRNTTRATSYTQEALQTAMQKINNKELSYAAASHMYGIPTSTLSDRVLKKTGIVSKTLGRSTAIPLELEIKLANCLRAMEKWGWGLSREEILEVTEEFVKKNDISTPFKNGRPGPDWFISFRQRHNLSVKKPQPVEYLRKKMTDPFVIDEYFTLLEKTLRELNLADPKRIWNLDETSVCLDPTKTKVVGAKGQPSTRTTCGSAKENITVLTTVNADGQKLDPLIIFKGKHMYKQWMIENTDNYDFEIAYAASKRGWIETEIFYNYMLNVIIPNLGEERPVLLLYDGHVTHVDDKVVALAVENNITILKLPAHTSHLLQPLDLAVFKSFKTMWDKKLVAWQRQNVGVKLRKQCFTEMFADTWQQIKPEVIRNGFKKGGICPFNATVIPKEKFDPAAYARWQKHLSQATYMQPKSLKQLCLNEISKTIYDSSASAPITVAHSENTNTPALNSKEGLPQTLNISFEELLLKKVTQNPHNKMAVKLKRIAKGAEVITRTFLKKQEEIELNKAIEKQAEKALKQRRKRIPQSISNPVKPGPSGIQRKTIKKEKHASTATILTIKTANDRFITKKGKGIGKKTRTGKENLPSKDDEKYYSSDVSHSMIDLTTVSNNPNINEKPGPTTKCVSQKKEKKSGRGTATNKSVKKRKRSSSIDTTDESIQMSAHSDSDLIDSFSDILSDCDLWNKTDSINHERNRTELESKELQIEQIVKEIREMDNLVQTHNTCEETIKKEKNRQHNDSEDTNIQDSVKKVTILSSIRLTPENQSFYKSHKRLRVKPIDKDCDLFIPKNGGDDDITYMKKYNIGDTVLVRYYNKTWKHYAGVIKDINLNSSLYTISYYKTIGKKIDVKFVFPKRTDQDCVPDDNIVKVIILLQIKEFPEEYTLMDDDDAVYF